MVRGRNFGRGGEGALFNKYICTFNVLYFIFTTCAGFAGAENAPVVYFERVCAKITEEDNGRGRSAQKGRVRAKFQERQGGEEKIKGTRRK